MKIMRGTTKNISVKRAASGNNRLGFHEMPAANPVIIDILRCTGCNRCVNICQVDIIVPNLKKGGPPVVMFPGECWYCGCCVVECQVEGAIKLRHPLINRAYWIAKEKLK
jgi:NAD-dependent dihydropyrimidine dehydrogenase PreA subunit